MRTQQNPKRFVIEAMTNLNPSAFIRNKHSHLIFKKKKSNILYKEELNPIYPQVTQYIRYSMQFYLQYFCQKYFWYRSLEKPRCYKYLTYIVTKASFHTAFKHVYDIYA
jgi:hypothetical protein